MFKEFSDYEDLRREARERILETLENGYDGYLCDLHNEVFNMSLYCYSVQKSKDILKKYDIFEIFEKIKDWEMLNFGDINTNFADPSNVLNMLWYLIGEEEIWKILDNENFNEYWNDCVDDEIRETLIEFLKREA